MELSYIMQIVTVIVALILGEVSKKSKFINNNMIPVQNLIIGFLGFVIDYIVTKDFNTAIAFSGLIAGGIYDIGHNLKKLNKGE